MKLPLGTGTGQRSEGECRLERDLDDPNCTVPGLVARKTTRRGRWPDTAVGLMSPVSVEYVCICVGAILYLIGLERALLAIIVVPDRQSRRQVQPATGR